jgi:hypothetical protein
LDIYAICQSGLFKIAEFWDIWRSQQTLVGSDVDISRARLALETHLERIALHRPLEKIEDDSQREQARKVRDWFWNEFLRVNDA